MEESEVEKAAEELVAYEYEIDYPEECIWIKGFKAGANWQKERDKIELSHYAYQIDRAKRDRDKAEAELTRTSKELDAMTTKYNELSRKYDDLYRKLK